MKESKRIIGVDIGGTSIKFAIIDTKGNIKVKWNIPTVIENKGRAIPDSIIESIKNKLKELNLSKTNVLGIGVGVPGPVSQGVVKRAVNLGWENFPLKKLMEEKLGLPTCLLNDANAAALGELWVGAAAGKSDLLFVTIGTGVGGGIIVDGKVINGSNSSGGEIGHLPVTSEESRLCGCGNRNCLECFASAKGMIQTMNQKLSKQGKSPITTTEELFSMKQEGNREAIETIEMATDYLARGIASILNTIDSQEVVIGGGVSEAGKDFLVSLYNRINQYVFPQIRNKFLFRKAEQGNDAGVLGAAYQTLTSIGQEKELML